MKQENDKLEFKREVNDSLIKEVIAFCNSYGGTIIIGYNDDGSIYGLKNARKDLDKISNKLHDSIEPDVSFLVAPRIENEDGKDIIIIEVLQGTSKPYYIKSKGMIPDGVYVRVGATSQPSTRDSIRDMLIDSSDITFEKNLSINQNLTFLYIERIFQEKSIAFGTREKKTLGILNSKDKYTNLALLLSDQCPYTIKMAVYTDTTKKEFIDKKETNTSSILQQLDEAESYLKLNNKVSGKIQGMERIDNYDYPEESIREILLNCFAHRNYEIPGSTLIHIFTNRIEFLSLGGLTKGLTVEDIKLGSSSSRNPKLVSVFHRLGLVEAYGSGIPRMLELYKNSIYMPNIQVAPNSFLVEMPKLLLKKDYVTIIDFLRSHTSATRKEIEKILETKKVTTITILNEMVDRNLIIKEGQSRNIIYKIK
ncbi:MAG: putative DNA binding domain-containing protein [Clostridia bacterium]